VVRAQLRDEAANRLLKDLDAAANGRRETFAFDERVAACRRDEQQMLFGGALISSALLRRRLISLARDRASRVSA
jgi:hypothetical protein